MRFGLHYVGVVTAGLLLGSTVGVPLANAQAGKQDKKIEHPPDEPGPIHKGMAKLAGNYKTTTKFAFSPDAKPEETTGTAKLTSVMDGRFLLEENTGKMMGKDYKGLKLWGYNGVAGQFESTWTYTEATGMMRLVGTSNDDGKTIQWKATVDMGKGSDPMTLYAETHLVSPDQFTVELYAKDKSGKRGPSFVTTYTRNK
jgi:hypothetical protein